MVVGTLLYQDFAVVWIQDMEVVAGRGTGDNEQALPAQIRNLDDGLHFPPEAAHLPVPPGRQVVAV